jgi:hypothetical protein
MKNVLRFGAVLCSLLLIAAFAFPQTAMAAAYAISPEHGQAVLAAVTGIGTVSGMHLACVVVPVEAIVLDECPNPGGLTDLMVIRRRDIDTFPEPDADKVTISTPIVPKVGCGFVPWEFAQETGQVNHKSSGEPGNKTITQEVKTYVPRGSAATDAVIQSAINGDFVVIGRDANGNQRIAGDKHRGVIFDHDYKSGLKGTDKNGTDFTFAADGFAHVPYYYTAAIPVKI